MGIQGLTKLLTEKAPGCLKESNIKAYAGRVIAVDASMSIYQFIIAMKMASESGVTELSDAQGQVTSHLQGMWGRTLRMLGEGLRPVYVFDGAPPEMKRKELEERKARAAEAQAELKRATEEGDAELIEKMSKRTVRVSKEQTEECKKLLQLMGVPCIDAKTEAEAQCAELVRAKKAWAVGTEDMDALTFGSAILLRHLSYSEAKKQPILEFHLRAVLESLDMNMAQFVDMCILLGCDYCPRIPGIGPVKAFEGIKKHKTIDAFLKTIDKYGFFLHTSPHHHTTEHATPSPIRTPSPRLGSSSSSLRCMTVQASTQASRTPMRLACCSSLWRRRASSVSVL